MNQEDTSKMAIAEPEAMQLARELDTKAQALGCPLDRFSDALRHQHARIADLEAQLYAVGAGGVGQSIRPAVQADAAQAPDVRIRTSVPTGWKLVPMEPTAAMLDAAFDTEVVHTEWGVDAFVENTAEVYGAMLAAAPEAPAQQPVATVAEVHMSRYTIEWENGPLPEGTQLYAAPQHAAQQKPVAWICAEWSGSGVPELSFDGPSQELSVRDELTRPVWTPLYAAPQPTENLRCKSTQKRLATLWGYEEARQPLTDSQVKELVKKHPAEDLCRWSYGMGIKDAEAAHGITESQQ